MRFEEAFKHYQEGIATNEEIEYVKAQLAAANEFLDMHPSADVSPVKEADKTVIKKARKGLRKMVLIPVTISISILIVIATVLSGVFGYAANSASKSARYDSTDCSILAVQEARRLQYIKDSGTMPSEDSFYVEDVDKQFIYDGKNLSKSYYIYEIEIKSIIGYDFVVVIDSRTGNVIKSYVD